VPTKGKLSNLNRSRETVSLAGLDYKLGVPGVNEVIIYANADSWLGGEEVIIHDHAAEEGDCYEKNKFAGDGES